MRNNSSNQNALFSQYTPKTIFKDSISLNSHDFISGLILIIGGSLATGAALAVGAPILCAGSALILLLGLLKLLTNPGFGHLLFSSSNQAEPDVTVPNV